MAVRAVARLATGTDLQIDCVMRCHVLATLPRLLADSQPLDIRSVLTPARLPIEPSMPHVLLATFYCRLDGAYDLLELAGGATPSSRSMPSGCYRRDAAWIVCNIATSKANFEAILETEVVEQLVAMVMAGEEPWELRSYATRALKNITHGNFLQVGARLTRVRPPDLLDAPAHVMQFLT